jgi:hypothetical protein
MGKHNIGRFTEQQTEAAYLARFEHPDSVIGAHRRLLRWCLAYARTRQRDALSLRDVPDDLFAALSASEDAKYEALAVLHTWANPTVRIDADDLAAMFSSALVAIDMEALRRHGEVELRDESPLFDPLGAFSMKPVEGSSLDRLATALTGTAGVS